MNARAIPAKAESDGCETRNEEFKKSFESWLWGSMIAATVVHFMLFQFWPTLTVEDVSFTVEELKMIEIPPPPEAISRPAMPVMATADIDDDITIAPTTFADNPIAELPPPPTDDVVGDVSAAPVFTPMTGRPEIANLAEVQTALLKEYPANLRDTGITRTVIVWFFVSEEGEVLDGRVFAGSGFRGLDEAALNVADVFRFTPALNRDELVPVWIQFPIEFQIR